MSRFAADWLALREPYDLRARNAAVLDAVAATFARAPAVSVVDLACGTGATLRALAARLPHAQNWRLVDNDLGLLGRAAATTPPPGTRIVTTPVDLARDLELALDGPLDLIATSALLDLVSGEWLQRFAVEAAARRLPVYAALSYDGRASFAPADPLDAIVTGAVNRHQLTDKGFGPALGPKAAAAARDAFERAGYGIVEGASDWVFGPADRDIQTEVVTGWAAAARAIGTPALPELLGWVTRRHQLIAAGRSQLRVGHRDLFAQPAERR